MNKKDKAEMPTDNKGNTGKNNSGHWNSGDWNSGYWNSGHRNSGDWNSGDMNSGDWNSGHWNSGDRNSGHRNSGDWNSGYWNSGFFNTDEPKVRIFNQETDLAREDIDFPDYFYFELTDWVYFNNMTDKEKEEHPNAKTTDGYLKTYDYKEAWKKSFYEADKEDVANTLKLPNFDYEIFEEITGISKEMIDRKLGKISDSKPNKIVIEGVEYVRKQEVENE